MWRVTRNLKRASILKNCFNLFSFSGAYNYWIDMSVALSVWTIIPGAISLLNLLRNCIGGKMGLGSDIVQFVFAALFVGGGTFLLTTVCRKNAN